MYQLTLDPDVVVLLDPYTRVPSGHRWWTDYENWLAAGGTPLPAQVATLADVQSDLCVQIDATADAAYIAIGGPSPGRLAEYKQAKADADAFKAAGYTGTAPVSIACWAQAQGWTAQQACDDILATAAQWEGALDAIRPARLIGKANVNAANDMAAAQAAADAAIANIRAVLTGL